MRDRLAERAAYNRLRADAMASAFSFDPARESLVVIRHDHRRR